MLQSELAALLPGFAERDASAPDAYPADNVAALVRLALLPAPLPASLGGRGSSLREMVIAVEAIASASPGTALLASMPIGLAAAVRAGLDVAPPEHRAACGAQAERIAADYGDGKLYAACNSEKGAGGSLAATKTIATRDARGDFRLDGEKILASFGTHADVFFSTAKLDAAVEFFLVDAHGPGVTIMNDWNGFGMRGTESHGVRYAGAPARERLGFPGFIDAAKPLQYWYCLFAAIPLGCARAVLHALGRPAPASPALRLRLSDATMRYEAMRAYLLETADGWRAGADASYAARVLRMKTYVTSEATKLSAELFALGGGRHYVRGGRLAGSLADAFAGTALRPPLPLALDLLVEGFSLDDV